MVAKSTNKLFDAHLNKVKWFQKVKNIRENNKELVNKFEIFLDFEKGQIMIT